MIALTPPHPNKTGILCPLKREDLGYIPDYRLAQPRAWPQETVLGFIEVYKGWY